MAYLIETERLGMRRFTSADLQDVLAFSSDEDVTRYTGDAGTIASLEDAERVLNDIWLAEYEQYGYARYALIHKGDNKLIGFCGWKFIAEEGKADLGYRMLPAYWGQGLGYEAAVAAMHYGQKILGLKQVFAEAVAENTGSTRIIEKLGFNFTKQYQLTEGVFDFQIRRYDMDLSQWHKPQ
ncbi:GNAT family N-acetyltransferase [Ferrimonas lipolytica]|nr:GNAT family N-acetyltransferase [Ferrimonas lipolytica]